MEAKPVITTTAALHEVRRGPLRMYFPVDPDTTRRLNNVIDSKPVKWTIDGKERLGWIRRLIRRLSR